MAVVLDANRITQPYNAQHLYVTMTRGSMKLVVCSSKPMLG